LRGKAVTTAALSTSSGTGGLNRTDSKQTPGENPHKKLRQQLSESGFPKKSSAQKQIERESLTCAAFTGEEANQARANRERRALQLKQRGRERQNQQGRDDTGLRSVKSKDRRWRSGSWERTRKLAHESAASQKWIEHGQKNEASNRAASVGVEQTSPVPLCAGHKARCRTRP
jgi:hypothetical protein